MGIHSEETALNLSGDLGVRLLKLWGLMKTQCILSTLWNGYAASGGAGGVYYG